MQSSPRLPTGPAGPRRSRAIARAKDLLAAAPCVLSLPLGIAMLVRDGGWAADRPLMLVALATSGVGGVLLLLLFGGPWLAGTDRARMGAMFGPWLRVTFVLIAVSMLAQAALLDWVLVSGRMRHGTAAPVVLLLSVAVAAGIVVVTLVKAAARVLDGGPVAMRGALLTRGDQPRLHEFVGSLAATLGTRPPDHIVAGLEPVFFVTSSAVHLPGREAAVEGHTLFVSLALMRLLQPGEFAAIVGHELGHFRGDDLTYSRKFAPVYTRMVTALAQLSQSTRHLLTDLAKMPALFVLKTCLLQFAIAERSVGRERELLADQAGVQASDRLAFARALLKTALMGPAWPHLQQALAGEINQGRRISNLPQTYVAGCAQLVAGIDWDAACAQLAQSVQAHPVDTHPPLGQRLVAVGVAFDELEPADIGVPASAATELLNDATGLEQRLSELEACWLVHIRAAAPPARDGGQAPVTPADPSPGACRRRHY